jgi:hypothetical protein
MILSGPFGPKFIADAFVVSEKVGDGGPGDIVRLGVIANERSERALDGIADEDEISKEGG